MSSHEQDMLQTGVAMIPSTGLDHRFLDQREGANPADGSRVNLEQEQRESDSGMERLDRLQEVQVVNGRTEVGEKIVEEMEAEITQLRIRLKDRASRLSRVEKDAKERNERKEMSIKRLEAKVAEMRRLNEDANREASRKAWGIKKLEEKVAELDQQVQGSTTMADMRRLLQERTAELSILEAENQRNASKAKKVDDLEAKLVVLNRVFQDKKARLSDLEEVQSRGSSESQWKGKGTEQSDAMATELNQRLQEEVAKVSKMQEAARRKEREMKVLEAKVAELNQRLRGEPEGSRWNGKGVEQSDEAVTKLNQRLQEEMAKAFTMEEAVWLKEKETKGLEAKMAELRQRLRGETEASRQKEKETRRLEVKVAELAEASRRKERDTERLEAQKAEIERRLQEKTVKLEEVARQNSRKERESKRLETKVAELELRLQEESVKLSNLQESSRRSSRKGEGSERLEGKVTELTTRLSGRGDDARRREQKNRDLSATNQKQRNEINQLKALIKTAGEQASKAPSQALVRNADSISAVEPEVANLVSGKGENRNSERQEANVVKLRHYLQERTAKTSSMEEVARHWEQKIRDLSVANQKQRDKINQMQTALRSTAEEAKNSSPQALVSSIFAVKVADLVRILNAQIEYASSVITDSLSNQESSSSGEASLVALNELCDYLGPWLFNDLRRRLNKLETEYDPLITQIALQTVLVRICNRIINHWNPPFWNDGSICFRVDNNAGGIGYVIAGTWSTLAPSYMTMSQSEIQDANVKYLTEILVEVITATGRSLQRGETLPSEYQEKMEDIAKRALELHQMVRKDASMGVATYIVPPNTQFDPSQMDDTEGSANKAGSVPPDSVICTLEMGLQYRKRAESGKQGGYGEECDVILKPMVVLSSTLEA